MNLVSMFLIISVANAQKISGIVKDPQGKGLDKSTISLLNAKDSSIIKLSVTNSNGKFVLNTAGPGHYLVGVSHIGYKTQYSKVFELKISAEITLPDFSMIKNTEELKGVTISSQKPMVEVKADKMILNVEGTINATGSDALELLRKSPGVMIDKDDNISLAGKNGVQIYIDGRPSPLTGTDLSNFLKSLQSAQIESIEIITNPSAKYEAAGNAGIINIKLKKNKTFGTNGSINAGYNIGTYSKYNGGLSLNHRNKKTNIYGNYNYNNSLNYNFMGLYRKQLDTLFNQQSNMKYGNTSHGFKAGIDYLADKKNTLGIMITGNLSDININNNSATPISYIPTGVTNRVLVADNSSALKRNNADFNFNYRYADTAGRELNLDADYGLFRLKSDQFQPNYYYDSTRTTQLSQDIYNFIAPTNIDIYSLKVDYEENFHKGKLGFGGKSSIVNTNNNFGDYNVYNSGKILDTSKSDQFNYKENINAGYVNYNRPFKGFMIQAGVRVENTNLQGKSYPLNADESVNYSVAQIFTRHYTDLFPSAAITFNKNPMKQWNLTYSRRIDRPAYQDLNPFEFKLDEYTYQKGNIDLRPQYTNSFGISNTYKYKLTTALNYSHVNDVFTQLVDTADKSKAFISKRNLAKQDIVSLNVSYPFQYKAYSAFMNLNSYYSHYVANFGGGSRDINLDVFAYTFYMQNTLKIGKKGWTGEVSGFYASPSVWQGTFKSSDIWSVDAGVQKSFLKGKMNAKISVSDIFKTLKWTGTSNFAGQYLKVNGNSDSRQLRFSITWRFGNNQVKATRQHKTGVEEEDKRTQSGGGIGQQ